jgi:hypothetical protein
MTSPAVARQRVLTTFIADTRQRLEDETSAFGKLIARHIGRQLDLARSDRYATWFHDIGEALGFDQLVTLAAIAGSDVTRTSQFSASASGHFGTTEHHVRDLAQQGDLRFGRAFSGVFGGLEDLYMHAEAGRRYTRNEIGRRAVPLLPLPDAEQLSNQVADAIMGHDSFNAGFGRHKLKPFLAAKHGGAPEDYDYPISRSPTGFLVQVLDRLEGFDPETMLRYVAEGVAQRKEPISLAIRSGIIDNVAYLQDVFDQIITDARSVLTDDAFAAFLDFPGMRVFADELERSPRMLRCFGTPPVVMPDGFYHLRHAGLNICLNTLESVRDHVLPSFRSLYADEQASPETKG